MLARRHGCWRRSASLLLQARERDCSLAPAVTRTPLPYLTQVLLQYRESDGWDLEGHYDEWVAPAALRPLQQPGDGAGAGGSPQLAPSVSSALRVAPQGLFGDCAGRCVPGIDACLCVVCGAREVLVQAAEKPAAVAGLMRGCRALCRAQWMALDCRYWRIDPSTPSSHLEATRLAVKATLIVCPVHILDQWASEIARHTHPGALKVLTYLGMKKVVASSGARCGASVPGTLSVDEIASADIVLTTYDALRADVYHDGTPGRQLRRGRVQVETSPVLCVTWWRVCLDEAQMVESATAKAAEMALKLSTRNRWCVTGTPGACRPCTLQRCRRVTSAWLPSPEPQSLRPFIWRPP